MPFLDGQNVMEFVLNSANYTDRTGHVLDDFLRGYAETLIVYLQKFVLPNGCLDMSRKPKRKALRQMFWRRSCGECDVDLMVDLSRRETVETKNELEKQTGRRSKTKFCSCGQSYCSRRCQKTAWKNGHAMSMHFETVGEKLWCRCPSCS